MKKILFSSVVLTFFTVSMIAFQLSCSKQSIAQITNSKAYTIEGLWVGTYLSNTTTSSSQFFSLSVKQDGTLICDSKGAGKQYLCIGTWALSGSNFTSDISNVWSEIGISNVTQHLTATYDSTTGKLTNGTWQNTSFYPASGTFNLTEVE